MREQLTPPQVAASDKRAVGPTAGAGSPRTSRSRDGKTTSEIPHPKTVDRIRLGLRSARTQEAVAKKRQAQLFETPEVLEILPSSFERAVPGVALATNGGDKLDSFDFR